VALALPVVWLPTKDYDTGKAVPHTTKDLSGKLSAVGPKR
jgi:hypothetical protein